MPTLPSKIQKLLADAPKRVVQIEGVLNIVLGADEGGIMNKRIAKALAAGKTVVEAGVSRWVECYAVRDNSKAGSDCYTWDKSGNRVKCEKILFTKDAAGVVTRESQGFCWRDALDSI